MKERGDATRPPISRLMKPMYVLQMNWWHFSDANRIKWLKQLKVAMRNTLAAVNEEIDRLERGAPK